MSSTSESGNLTGTKDKDQDRIWYTLRRARADSRKGAEMGKNLLRKRLSA